MGAYTLTLSEVTDDCGEGIGTTCTVGFGPDHAATGEIEVDGDADWFRLTVVAGRIYRFDVKGDSSTDNGGTLGNAGLTLYDASGNAIAGASNNQGGADNNARYIFRSGDTRIYLEARDDDGAGVGFYTVVATDVTTDHNVSEPVGQDFPGISGPDTGRVLVGGSVTGTLGDRNDHDVFQVDLAEGKIYQFDLKGSASGDGTLENGQLSLFSPFESGSVATDQTSGNAQITYFVPRGKNGAYRLRAFAGASGALGTYTLAVTELPDDCTSGTGTTCSVAVGGSTSGEISARGDTDWFRASLTQGRIYRIDVKGDTPIGLAGGTLANAGLTLYGASGTAVSGASNNQGGAHNNARYIHRATATGTIHIEARDDDGAGVGTYTVAVTDVTDQNISEPVGQDFPSTGENATGRVLVGGSVTGELSFQHDRDEFQVDLADGTIYQFDLKGLATGDGTLANPQLNLYDPFDLDYVATDQTFSDTPRNAQMTYFVPRGKNGAYIIRSWGGLSGAVGTYALTVAKAPDDCTSGTGTTCSVAVGGSTTGEIEADGDTDWFLASLTGGRTYWIDVKGDSSTDDGGSLANAGLTLYDASGTAISGASTNEGGADNNARYFHRATAAETIYIEARDNNGVGKGTYTVTVTEFLDDCTADAATTCSVAVGGSTAGEIEADGDTDWFKATLTGGRTYRIDVKGDSSTDDGGTLANAGLTLYDASGNAISGASTNEGGADNNARYFHRAATDETIYIEARDDDGVGVGTYTVTLTEIPDDCTADTGTTCSVAVGGTTTGEIEVDGDTDWFKASLTEGRIYRIDLKGDSGTDDGGTLANAGLTLYDASGTAISGASTNEGGADNNARYFHRATAAGTIYIEARDNNGVGRGTYTVTLTEIPDDCTADAATTCSVAVGGTTAGEIEVDGDTDWFKATLTGGRTYRIDVKGDSSTDDGGTLANAGLTLYDASGNAISGASTNEGGADNNARYFHRATAAETIYIEARDNNGVGVGTYTVAVTEFIDDCTADTGTTCSVAVGGTTTGEIEVDGDTDWFKASLTEGRIYRIDLKGDSGTDDGGTLANAGLTLYDASGNAISGASTNRGGADNNARYFHRATAAGTIYIEARDDDGVGVGTYTVTLTEIPDDCTSGTGTTCSVAVGGTTTGEIEVDGDTDWFRATLTEGRTYRIDLKGASGTDDGGTLRNAGLTLYDASGTAISGASTNEGGADNNARYFHRATAAGTIYIEARDNNGVGRGTYTVAVADVTGQSISEPSGQDFSNNHATTPGRILIGGVVTGKIEPFSDKDAFRVDLTAGAEYQIDLKGLFTGDGTLFDPYLALWSDVTGFLVSNDDFSGFANSRVTYTVPTDGGGGHTIRAASADEFEGTYTLSLTQTSSAQGSTGDEENSSGEREEVEAPPAPQDLTATVNEAGSVILTWNDPKDASITGYRILRRNRDTSEKGVFTAINDDTGSAATRYVDDTVEPGNALCVPDRGNQPRWAEPPVSLRPRGHAGS